jgi:two-component system NtrC family sensor kinase
MRVGEGIAGEVMATGQTIAISDTRTDPRFLEQSPTVTFRSLVVAPIQSNEQRVGTLSMQSNEAGVFDADDINLLGSLGTQAAIAIENARLLETTRQDLKEINALYHIMRRLVGSLDPEQLMRDVINLLKNEFGFNYVQIYLVDAEANELLFCQGTGTIGEEFKRQKRRLSLGAGIIGYVAETGRPFLTNDVGQVIFHVPNPLLSDVQAELAMPIKTEDQVLGVLDVQHLSRHFTDRHMQLISAVADQLALALEKANLYTTVQDSLRQEKTMRAQLIQNERLTIMGRLLASVSHELNNPLQAIQNALFLLKEEKGISWQGHQDLEIVLSETERMGMLIERLRNVYRPSRSAIFQEVEINDLIEDVYTLVATHLRHSKITFEFHPDPQLPCIMGIPDQIRQVVLNLFVNAVQAMPSGGRIIVNTQQWADQDRIMFTVKDTGSGVDPQLLPHIFEPFITGKESGTGLGLTITHDIIQQHRGEITVENDPEGGALFRVWLPIHNEAAK